MEGIIDIDIKKNKKNKKNKIRQEKKGGKRKSKKTARGRPSLFPYSLFFLIHVSFESLFLMNLNLILFEIIINYNSFPI